MKEVSGAAVAAPCDGSLPAHPQAGMAAATPVPCVGATSVLLLADAQPADAGGEASAAPASASSPAALSPWSADEIGVVASPASPTVTSAQAAPPCHQPTVDESLVIVEDASEDEDENAVQTGVAHSRPVITVVLPISPSFSLSPAATPFFPGSWAGGRSKQRRWADDDGENVDDSHTSYLDAVRRPIHPIGIPTVDSAEGVESVGGADDDMGADGVGGTGPARRKRQRRHRRRRRRRGVRAAAVAGERAAQRRASDASGRGEHRTPNAATGQIPVHQLSDVATHRVRGHPEKGSGKDERERGRRAMDHHRKQAGNKNTLRHRDFREVRAECPYVLCSVLV